MSPKRSHFIYQDESGNVGTKGKFLVGLLFTKERDSLYEKIQSIRREHNYWREFHFSEIRGSSYKRSRVACEVLAKILRERIRFRALCIDNNKLKLEFFEPKVKDISKLGKKHAKLTKNKGMYRAYNYFTKRLLLENAGSLNEAVVYLDKKVRMRADNILEYLKREVNLATGRGAIKVVESRDSKKDDLVGIADLVLGSINYRMKKGKNPMKKAVVKVVEQYLGTKVRFRNWVFK